MYAKVELRGHEREFFYIPQNVDLKENDLVVCKHEQGLDIGKVLNVQASEVKESLGKIIRSTTEDDMRLLRSYEIKERNSLKTSKDIIEKHKLSIKLVDIQIHYDGQRMTFYFISEKRIDFRQLVKDLAGHYHTRIRMKQIGVRDYAKHLGGVGPCGLDLCCTRFLTSFKAIGLQILKDQNLSMTPQKVSGMCGRLLCCLMYEIDFYEEVNKKFPPCYSFLNTSKYGKGKIMKVDIFRSKITVQYENVEENGGVITHTLKEFNEIKEKKIRYVPMEEIKKEGKND
ncbi:hypothetical protein KAU15_00830 [candidate division WOR-3 bacterium]|nr:hypothetical protein [candidate division WOR-3 bacterium]